jgi:hypothetical protein
LLFPCLFFAVYTFSLFSLFTIDEESDSDSDSGPDSECPGGLNESSRESESEAGSTAPKKKGHNSIRARIQALTKFEDRVPHEKITAQTGVSRSSCYKLRSKAISRGWDPLGVLET